MNRTTRDLVALLARPSSNRVMIDLQRRSRRATADQIAARARVSPATLSPLLKRLERQGLVNYTETRNKPEGGRPLRHWQLDKRARVAQFEQAARRL